MNQITLSNLFFYIHHFKASFVSAPLTHEIFLHYLHNIWLTHSELIIVIKIHIDHYKENLHKSISIILHQVNKYLPFYRKAYLRIFLGLFIKKINYKKKKYMKNYNIINKKYNNPLLRLIL